MQDLFGSTVSEFKKKSRNYSQPLKIRKRIFLDRLTSPSGKKKYKRYIGSTLRYAGGKTLAVGLIVERIPENVKRVVSPFMGGGSVEVAVSIELGVPVL